MGNVIFYPLIFSKNPLKSILKYSNYHAPVGFCCPLPPLLWQPHTAISLYTGFVKRKIDIRNVVSFFFISILITKLIRAYPRKNNKF